MSRTYRRGGPPAIDVEGLEVAWSIEDRFDLSFWDSLIVAAAHVAGCGVILTEDLQRGMDLDGVRVVDPFRTSVADLHEARRASDIPERFDPQNLELMRYQSRSTSQRRKC